MIKKNIIIFMPSIEGGGVEKNLFIISNYLSKNFEKLSIITLSNQYKKKFDKNIKLISLKSKYWDTLGRRKKYFLCMLLLIKQFFLCKNFSIFCFQANIYCTFLCKVLGIKIILRSNSSPSGWSKNFLKKLIFNKIMNFADCVIVNSKEFQKELKKKLNVDSKCIYNPLNKKEIVNLSKKKYRNTFFKKNYLNLINVGRIVDQKDQITILKAANILKIKNIKFRLIIIGSGILTKNLKTFIKNNQLSSFVKIIKFTSNPFPIILKSDVFLLSSLYEGLPNVLLEALTLNKFVISSKCPTGPSEILDNGRGGILFKCRDHKQLANKIIFYKNNKEKCNKMLSFSRSRLYRFDYNENLKKYKKIVSSYL